MSHVNFNQTDNQALIENEVVSTVTEATNATPEPKGEARSNSHYITALEENATFSAPSGTPILGNTLYIEITASGTRTLGWNAIYSNGNTHTRPTSIGDGETIRLGYKYDGTNWVLIAKD